MQGVKVKQHTHIHTPWSSEQILRESSICQRDLKYILNTVNIVVLFSILGLGGVVNYFTNQMKKKKIQEIIKYFVGLTAGQIHLLNCGWLKNDYGHNFWFLGLLFVLDSIDVKINSLTLIVERGDWGKVGIAEND